MDYSIGKKDFSTVIVGSFRKHLAQILRLKHQLEAHEIHVLAPSGDEVVDPDAEFIVFRSDPVSDPKLLQNSVFAKIRRSSFIVIANFDGYLGRAAILEIGYAIAHGIEIFTFEPIDEPHIGPYCRLLKEILPAIDLSSEPKSGVRACGSLEINGQLSMQ